MKAEDALVCAKGRLRIEVRNNLEKPVSVILSVREYRRMLAELEELEEIRAYDRAKASRSGAVPFEQAVEEIESRRP